MSLLGSITIEDRGQISIIADLSDIWGQISIIADSTEDYQAESDTIFIRRRILSEFLRLRGLGYI